MNEQPRKKLDWKELVEEIKLSIHNMQIQLELMKAQLKEAEVHAR